MTAIQAIAKLRQASTDAMGSFRQELDTIEAELAQLRSVMNDLEERQIKLEEMWIKAVKILEPRP